MTDIRALETPRLVLHPLQESDAAAVQAIFPQWEVVRFLSTSVPWPYPADGARTFIRERVLPAMARGTAWHWSIRPKSASEKLIGIISLMEEENNNRGFWIDPNWQGQGLMSEASAAATAYWFETLGKSVLRVPKAVANMPSRRISEREGMRVIATDERDYVSGRLLTELWEITREEWQERHPGPREL